MICYLDEIASKFNVYKGLFPNEVIKLNDDLKHSEIEIDEAFERDIKRIKGILNEKHVKININFKSFDNPMHLYQCVLYRRSKIPQSQADVIKLYVANMHLCKRVLHSLIRYMYEKIINFIRNALDDYENRRDNRLIKNQYEFINCCENVVSIIWDYKVFYEQIEINLDVKSKATILKLPSRYEMIEGIKQSLMRTDKAQHVIFPAVRLGLEFIILEDIAIKLRQRLHECRCYKDVKDIIFTRKMSKDELFQLMKEMDLCNNEQIDIIDRIYEWGSRSVHQGQMLPISLIWSLLFFIEDDLRNMMQENSKLQFKETQEKYLALLYDQKIQIINSWQTYFPSFYNRA